MTIVEIVGFASRRAVAAAHDDEYYEATAGEPAGLWKEGPRSDVISRLNLACCAVGDDNQRMFARKIGVNEERAEPVGRCLSPGDARLSLVHLQCVGNWPHDEERDAEYKKATIVSHGIKLSQ